MRDPVIWMSPESPWIVSVDGTIMPAHRWASGAQKGGAESAGIGLSKGGLTRKVVALTDAVGHLIRFGVLPGQTHDLKAVPELLDGLTCEMLIVDTAFDADWVLASDRRSSGGRPSRTRVRISSRPSRIERDTSGALSSNRRARSITAP